MDGMEVFFLICAVVGGLFVLVQLIMQFIGGLGDFAVDLSDSDTSFRVLSLHSLTSFLMMFGLTGFALYRQEAINLIIALMGAAAAGLASVWLIGKLFAFVLSMQSSGTVTMEHTIGGEGDVYLTIPPRGTGRVMITFDNRLREFDAVAHDQEGIKTGERVRVVNVKDNVLLVERIARRELTQS